MFLKFVNRQDGVPHQSLMIECDSFRERQVRLQVGETMEKYSPAIEGTHFPFEDDSRWEAAEEETQVLIVTVHGAKGYQYIAGRYIFLFIMNNAGETIDKTVV